ncbi:MAG: TRNA and rRNA cytosine-C5-methylase [Cytophagales bacterium]|nr:RsmB/NOP family class I SAM-dependent RNA methyltransferase [Bacteroidota bacterium]MBS1982373.1 RsmB/NOP family class I SAM-dependent RNA methyltransferase [Bacteroidota bacterium]WHZ06695.1 MAG: TRNA and rRNA cytosine-C5-methylase [Cytophagales bacterium]
MRLYRNLCEAVVATLHEIFTEKRYADKAIEKKLKQNSKWGARDRRFIAETTYDIVRWYRLFKEVSEANESDYWKLLAVWCVWNGVRLPDWPEMKLNDNLLHDRFAKIQNNRKIVQSIPDWLDELGERELSDKWPKELRALNEEAHVFLRANSLKVSKQELQRQLADEEVFTKTVSGIPEALLLEERQNIFNQLQFKEGLFEVQDAGSQLIAPFLEVQPGQRVIDACAGGGGKTLHLASLMQNKGRIIALDTEAWKLEELKKRARRAGANNIEIRIIDSSKTIKRLENSADRLLLDVPCSGLGVLKRNPDAKWKLSLDFMAQVKITQEKILDEYSAMLKPNGLMVYSTCSILPSENNLQVKKFLKAHSGFELVKEKSIMPSEGFDGFYMALIRKR